MPQTISFDFTCTELTPSLRLPVTGGVTALYMDVIIEAKEDPPGGIVGFFALRGDNVSKRKNKPRRPGLVMLEQGEREQIKLVMDPDIMIGGFPLPSPGLHHISLDWEGRDGISIVKNQDTGSRVSNVAKPGPIVGEKGITDGMVIIGGDPMPGGKVDYIPPYNWRFTGTIIVDKGDIRGSGIKPPEIVLPPNPPSSPNPGPIPEPIPDPVPIPNPPSIPPSIPSPPVIPSPIPNPPPPVPPPVLLPPSSNSPNWSAFPSVITALSQFYPPLANNLSRLTPYIQALNAGMELADDGFDLTDPADLIAVFQLISLFKGLKGK